VLARVLNDNKWQVNKSNIVNQLTSSICTLASSWHHIYRPQRSRHWWYLQFCRDCKMATRPRLLVVLKCLRRYLMRLHGWSSSYVAPITSLTRLRPELIQFKIAVLAYKVLHGTAPRYFRLSVGLIITVVSALPALIAWSCHNSNYPLLTAKHLRSLLLRHGALPEDVTTPPTLLIFRKRLKSHLFRQYYPDIVP